MISVNISYGELVDKITILEIKEQNIKDEDKLKNIKKELKLLNKKLEKIDIEKIFDLKRDLFKLNRDLWALEDRLREFESKKRFDTVFIELARNVYILNDQRYRRKKKINELLNSKLVEEKSYEEY